MLKVVYANLHASKIRNVFVEFVREYCSLSFSDIYVARPSNGPLDKEVGLRQKQ